MRTDQDRSNAYDLKTAPTTVGLKVAAQLTTMRSSFAAMTNSLVASQLLTATELDDGAIVGPMRGRYHAFSNRLWKICRHYNGLAATAMGQVEIARWTATCDKPLLITIALNVHSLVLV